MHPPNAYFLTCLQVERLRRQANEAEEKQREASQKLIEASTRVRRRFLEKLPSSKDCGPDLQAMRETQILNTKAPPEPYKQAPPKPYANGNHHHNGEHNQLNGYTPREHMRVSGFIDFWIKRKTWKRLVFCEK